MKTCNYWYKAKDKKGEVNQPCGNCKDCKEHIENNNTDKWHP